MIREAAKTNGIFSWEYRRDHDRWTEDAIKVASTTIQNKDLYPICVPAYKRGKNSQTLKALDGAPDLKVFIYGYKDDAAYSEYIEFINRNPTWKFIECNFTENGKPVKGLRYKRVKIVDDMYEWGTPKHWQIDDDIVNWIFCWTKRWENKPGKPRRRSAKTIVPFVDALKTYQLVIDCYKDPRPLGVVQCAWDIACSFRVLSGEDMNEPELDRQPCAHAVIWINAEECKKKNVNYDLYDGWEDFSFFIKVREAGIHTRGIRWLTYDTAAMNADATVATEADPGTHRWTIKTMEEYKVWGEIIRPREQNGQINTKVRVTTLDNWPRDANGKYKKFYNPVLLELCNNNDVTGFEKKILEMEANKTISEYVNKLKIKEMKEDEDEEIPVKNVGFKF